MTITSTDHVKVEKNNGVLTLTLNRPDRLNAFSAEMISTLKAEISLAKDDEQIRVIVLRGEGRAFSAGGDVKGMGAGSPTQTYAHIGRLNELIIQMQALEKPIICAVHGYAAGAGFNLALASDLIVAEEDTKFILSFAKVGLISDGGGLYFTPRLIGIHRAKELLFTAKPITAEEAKNLGIVNQIFTKERFREEVTAYATELAQGPTVAYGFIKKIANQSLTATLEDVLELERITQATVVTTNDHKEGVRAFKEKRGPQFSGK